MKVSLVKCAQYDPNEIIRSIEKGLRPFGGIKAFVKKGQKVLLKPNMLIMGSKESCISTHPEMLRAVIKLVKKAGGRPFVGDSPGFFSARRVASSNGILDVCKQEKVELIEFSHNKPVFSKSIKKRFPIAEEVLNAEVIINLPKVKTHGVTLFTGAVKNLFGCVAGLRKAKYHLQYPDHDEFARMLAELAYVIKPSLNIIDGVYGMDGKGPSGGNPKTLGFIGVSDNPVALDIAVCQALGFKDDEVITNVYGRALFKVNHINYPLLKPEQLGINDFKKYTKSRQANFGAPVFLTRFLTRLLSLKPIVDKQECRACKACIKVCPAHTIKLLKKADIDYSGCIRCYCCYEVCAYKAIELKRRL